VESPFASVSSMIKLPPHPQRVRRMLAALCAVRNGGRLCIANEDYILRRAREFEIRALRVRALHKQAWLWCGNVRQQQSRTAGAGGGLTRGRSQAGKRGDRVVAEGQGVAEPLCQRAPVHPMVDDAP
jgi:hypothetical protein